eukprot:5667_1
MGNIMSVSNLEQYYASICCDRKSTQLAKKANLQKVRKKRAKKRERKSTSIAKQTIFINSNDINISIDCVGSVNECESTMRVLECLRYYNSLTNNTSDIDRNKLIKYCNERITLLNDIMHVITKHNDELEAINYIIISKQDSVLTQCNLSNCSLSQRHFRDRRNDKSNTDDTEFLFWRDMIDSIHCYILHLYDAGLRIKNDNNVIEELDENEEFKTQHFDEHFSKICQQIYDQKNAIKQLKDFDKQPENAKYSINAQDDNEKDMTFLDGLYNHLSDQGILHKDLNKLKQFLKDEHFDSDAAEQDVLNVLNENESNMLQILNKNSYVEYCKDYVQNTKLSASSFNIGYIFYYWIHYKTLKKRKHDIEFFTNKNDHSGFELHDLYVDTRYNSLKYEILNNTICRLKWEQFQISLNKANRLIDTENAKKLSAGVVGVEDPLHYGIETGTTISIQNLLSIIIYCDWSELCTKFSKTFRKTKAWETITSVKNRNSEYANWSRILRETVQYFGSMGWDYSEDEKWNEEMNTEHGPFYCGINFVLVIPEFNIRLCSPTSTSKQLAVATKFGGDKGIIIQLNNNGNVGGHMLRCFNCSWLSNYKGEDERLFIGGDWTIRIETIRNIFTRENFVQYFKPLWYFDCMVTGTQLNDDIVEQISKKDYVVVKTLIQNKLEDAKHDYPQYITDTFEAFTNHKKQIVFNPYLIQHGLGELQNLIMQPLTPIFNESKSNETDNKGRRFGLNNFKHQYGKYINSTLAEVGTYAEYSTKVVADPFMFAQAGVNKLNEVYVRNNITAAKVITNVTNAPQIAANAFLKRRSSSLKNQRTIETIHEIKEEEELEQKMEQNITYVNEINEIQRDKINALNVIIKAQNAPQIAANAFLKRAGKVTPDKTGDYVDVNIQINDE